MNTWLPDGCTDAQYMEALEQALLELEARCTPGFVFYIAGVDPFERDRLLQSLDNAFAALVDRKAQLAKADWARRQLGKLTLREREVLDGLACGYPNKTIAYDLGISPRTVEVYRANAMTKLQVTSFADALRIAFAAGLGSDEAWRQAYRPKERRRGA